MERLHAILSLVVFTCLAKPYQTSLMGRVAGHRTLILVDDMNFTNSHSIFIGNLERRGHLVSIHLADSPEVQLKRFGDYMFDNLIFVAPKCETMNTIKTSTILEFVDQGGNLAVAVEGTTSSSVRSLLGSCGVTMFEGGSSLTDSFHSFPPLDTNVFLGSFWQHPEPVLYSGVGLVVDDGNILAQPLLNGNPTTLPLPSRDYADKNEISDMFRGKPALVVAIQARNNARIIISGSIQMFNNLFFNSFVPAPMVCSEGNTSDSIRVGNELFSESIMDWLLGERGVLRFHTATHARVDGTPPDSNFHDRIQPDLPISLYPDPEIARVLVYRINDEILFQISVEIFSPRRDESEDMTCIVDSECESRPVTQQGSWVPFCPGDLQLELVLLDTYVRKNMSCNQSGRNEVKLTVPDTYGIFKFRILYRRPGFSVLHYESQVSVRPFRHDEYERFIPAASPYYISAVSSVCSFLLLSAFFLWFK